jgi:hypothetical protein
VPLGDHTVEKKTLFISPGACRSVSRVLTENGCGHLLRRSLRRGDLRDGDGSEAEEQGCDESLGQMHEWVLR